MIIEWWLKRQMGEYLGHPLPRQNKKLLMEIQRQYSEYIKKFENEIEAMVLWVP